MNVGKLVFWIALVAALAPAKLALAGAAGHGGAAVVCPADSQMLDLYEGTNVYGLTFRQAQTSTQTAAAIANSVLRKLNNYPAFQALLKTEIAGILSNARVMDIDAQNIPTDDVFPIITRAGCTITTAAAYVNNEDIILIDQSIFGRFNVMNQAALYLHEAVFKIAREHANAVNSVSARKITAYLLSDSTDLSKISRELAALNVIPYPSFGRYVTVPDRHEQIQVQVSPNAETVAVTIQSDNSDLNACNGVYKYSGMVDYSNLWLPADGSDHGCFLRMDRPFPSRASIIRFVASNSIYETAFHP